MMLFASSLWLAPYIQGTVVDDASGLVQSAVSANQKQPWLAPMPMQPPMQPMPWAVPQQAGQPMFPMAPQPPAAPQPWLVPQPPQQQPQQQPQQPGQPQLVPWAPKTAPLLTPSSPAGPAGPPSAPINKYIFNMIPDNKMMCLQGPKSYLTSALERIRRSPMAPHYAAAQVKLGMCKDFTYINGPFPGTCYPRAAIYTDNDPLHVMTMIDFDESEAQFHAGARNIPVEAAMQELKTACDDGSMEQGLQLASEEFQAQVYVPHQSALIPDNGMMCMQGTTSYLKDALKQIRTTPLAPMFANVDSPRPGMCSEQGYDVGSGAVVAAGHGRIRNKCFPKATNYWDRNETHLDMLMWAETRWLKGPSHGFNFSKYEERREEIREMCGGRTEAIYQPLPPNLR